MIASPGDRIIVESERVGSPAREGTIEEVLISKSSTRFRVRWDDGHETTFLPYAGSARIVPAAAAPAKAKGKGRARQTTTHG